MKKKISIVTLSLVGLLIIAPINPALAQFGAPANDTVASPKTEEKKAMPETFMTPETEETVVRTQTTQSSANADLNGDGRVEFIDLNILLGAWGKCLGAKCPADFDNNRAVNEQDLDAMRSSWTGGSSSEIATMLARCRSINDAGERFSCFLKVAQELEVNAKEVAVRAAIQNKSIVVPNSNIETRIVERAFKHMLIYINNLIKRGYIIINRLNVLADRIETRIAAEEQERGVDLTESKRLLSEARNKLSQARSQIGQIAATYEKTIQTNPNALFESIRTAIDTMKDARSLLIEAVNNLKSRIVS